MFVSTMAVSHGRWLIVLTAGFVALAACSAPQDHRPRSARASARQSGPSPALRQEARRRASIRYEMDGKPFPLPLVTGTIGGHRTVMLVDTGANSHVIAGWFARKKNLALKKLGDVGADHVGRSIATYRVEKTPVTIDGWGTLDGSALLATEVPDVFEKFGIAAFISPQQLREDGDAVVVDLARGELRAAWWDEAHYDLSASGVPLVQGDGVSVCEDTLGTVHGLAFVVPAAVEGQSVQLLVDTGALRSDLFTGSAAGQKLAPSSIANREPLYTASGKISARRLRAAKVTAGSFTTSADVELIQGSADGSCPRDGVLAMDVLKSCALLFAGPKIYGRCEPVPSGK